MANLFLKGETVICLRNVKDDSGEYTDPATSMTISITDSNNGPEVDEEGMVKDSTGHYHYDYTIPAGALRGDYIVTYTATDGARISKHKDKFVVE